MTKQDKNAIIRELKKLIPAGVGLAAVSAQQAVSSCIQAVRTMPEEEDWIPVKKELPERYENVLIICASTVNGRTPKIVKGYLSYDEMGRDMWYEKITTMYDPTCNPLRKDLYTVTHWRPLPAMPGEDAGGSK